MVEAEIRCKSGKGTTRLRNEPALLLGAYLGSTVYPGTFQTTLALRMFRVRDNPELCLGKDGPAPGAQQSKTCHPPHLGLLSPSLTSDGVSRQRWNLPEDCFQAACLHHPSLAPPTLFLPLSST